MTRLALVPARHRLGPVAGQLVQDGALAALIGGNLFGRVAMHPALADVSDAAERGQVLNRAWRRYGTVNSLAPRRRRAPAASSGSSTCSAASTSPPSSGCSASMPCSRRSASRRLVGR